MKERTILKAQLASIKLVTGILCRRRLGAIGCSLAPGLQKAVGVKNFRVIARGARKARLENHGVTINGANYKFNIVAPEEKGEPADLIIVIVKYGALPSAIKDIANQVGEDTIIVAFMNGIDSEEMARCLYLSNYPDN